MFELKESKKIELLDVNAQIYKHSIFNTQHIHFDADNDEKVFMVAFRTIPEDSTGVAHILEHTSLCGSQKYPVRDPFFMMIRRSLNSFMNAFTSSHWTAYPFATQNDKDFKNLLDFHSDHDSKATMCVREYAFQVPYGVVQIDNYNIKEIKEKPVHKFFVNAGIYVLNKTLINKLISLFFKVIFFSIIN
mgnify:CR=1 FL=1